MLGESKCHQVFKKSKKKDPENLNFSKAFDTVFLNTPISKLKKCGLDE